MDLISENLRTIFAVFFYPAIVIFVFAFLFFSVGFVVYLSKDWPSRIRRLMGATLPVVSLVFIVVGQSDQPGVVGIILAGWDPFIRVLLGVALGFVLLLLGTILEKKDTNIGASLHCLFLSLIGTFILYCFLEKLVHSIHLIVLGMILGGGIHVIFLGPPFLRVSRDKGLKGRTRQQTVGGDSETRTENGTSSGDSQP